MWPRDRRRGRHPRACLRPREVLRRNQRRAHGDVGWATAGRARTPAAGTKDQDAEKVCGPSTKHVTVSPRNDGDDHRGRAHRGRPIETEGRCPEDDERANAAAPRWHRGSSAFLLPRDVLRCTHRANLSIVNPVPHRGTTATRCSHGAAGGQRRPGSRGASSCRYPHTTRARGRRRSYGARPPRHARVSRAPCVWPGTKPCTQTTPAPQHHRGANVRERIHASSAAVSTWVEVLIGEPSRPGMKRR